MMAEKGSIASNSSEMGSTASNKPAIVPTTRNISEVMDRANTNPALFDMVNKLGSDLKELERLKNRFTSFAIKNKIILAIGEHGLVGPVSADFSLKQENILHSSRAAIQIQLEHCMNRLAIAKLYAEKNNLTVQNITSLLLRILILNFSYTHRNYSEK